MGFPLNGFTRFFFEEVSGRGEVSWLKWNFFVIMIGIGLVGLNAVGVCHGIDVVGQNIKATPQIFIFRPRFGAVRYAAVPPFLKLGT